MAHSVAAGLSLKALSAIGTLISSFAWQQASKLAAIRRFELLYTIGILTYAHRSTSNDEEEEAGEEEETDGDCDGYASSSTV